MTIHGEDLAALLAALERGESLPARWYTDPAIVELETDRIFRKAWAYVGPLAELSKVGDYVTGLAGRVPVVVVRNDGGLAGFVNVCRHRRHEVLSGRGNVAVLQCPYHAWTYDLEGKLRKVPRASPRSDLRLEDLPLLSIRAEVLGPFVFVTLDADAPALVECYGPVLDRIAQSGVALDSLQFHSRQDWRAGANWKTVLENYLECYHCPVAHPGFSAAIDVRPDAYALSEHGWFSSQSGPVRPAVYEGRGKAPPYDVRGAVRESQYHFLWPNLTININPGFPNLSVDVWRPDGPNATAGFSEQYFAPGVDEGFARTLIAFNRQVADEDDRLTDSVQRGLMGGLPERGRFLPDSEGLVIHFQRMVARAVGGLPPLTRQ